MAILVAGGLLVAMRPAVAGSSDENSFSSSIASERSTRGLRAFVYDSGLAQIARNHSQDMANQGRLHHNDNLGNEVSGWQELGENVGQGYSAPDLHDAFMASSSHRAEILGNFDKIGIGTVWKDGTLWVTQVFFRAEKSAPPAPAPASSAPAPAPLVSKTKVVSDRSPDPIRQRQVSRAPAPRRPIAAAAGEAIPATLPLSRGRLDKLLGDLVVVPQDAEATVVHTDSLTVSSERGMANLLWRAAAIG